MFLGLVGVVAGWLARAPADPPGRAAYLCAPVILVASTAAHLEAAMNDDGRVIPAEPPWRFDPGGACMRLVQRVSEDLGS